MKFLRLAACAALCLSAVSAQATSTRVLALGGAADGFEDVDNVGRWYGSLPGYADLLLVELGRYVDSEFNGREGAVERQALGVHYALGAGARWGVAGLYLANDDPASDLRLLWGLRRGRLSLGVQYAYVSDSVHDQYLVDVREADAGTYGLGLRWELGERTYVDAAGDFTRRRASWYRREGSSYDSGVNDDSYGWRLRGFHELSPGVVLAPWFSLAHDEGPGHTGEVWYWGDVEDLFTTYRELKTGGLALNLLPDGDTFVVLSAAVSRLYQDHTDPFPGEGSAPAFHGVARRSVRFGVGAERRLLGWLTLRAGAWKEVSDTDVETPMSTLAGIKEDDMDLSVGLGLHLGGFDLDAVFADDAPFNAGSLLTNAGETASSTWSSLTLQFQF